MDKVGAKDIRSTIVPAHREKGKDIPLLRLSPSSIAVFKQCRQRYRFLYIDKLGDKYGRPRPYFTMANHVHASLKDFLSLEPVELRHPLLSRNSCGTTGDGIALASETTMMRRGGQKRHWLSSTSLLPTTT